MNNDTHAYHALEKAIRIWPPLGLITHRIRPNNLHFQRYKKYYDRQRLSRISPSLEHNKLWEELKSPMVSILISSFNYEDYVHEAIESCENQSNQIEVICVDDCSTDNSNSVIKKKLQENTTPMLFVQHKHNLGLAKARNSGVNFARGKYVFILDADNIILPNSIPPLVQIAEEQNSVASYGKLVKVDAKLNRIGGHLSQHPPKASQLHQKNYIDAMALFSRDYLLNTGGYDEHMVVSGGGNEDWEMWVRILKQHPNGVSFLDEEVGLYRVKPDSMLSSTVLSHKNNKRYIHKKHKIK